MVREIREETGLSVKNLKEAAWGGDMPSFGWFGVKKLPKDLNRPTKRLLKKLRYL